MADGYSYLDEVLSGLIPVQEGAAGARRQPAPGVQPMPGMPQPRPRPRPQPAPQSASPQPPPAAPSKPYSYADEILAPVKPAQAASADPLAEPDADTWWGRRVQDVRGKQDPRYKGLPTLADTGAVNLGDDSVAKLAMPNDQAYGDILSKSMADGVKMTRRFKDANDYEIIGFMGPDGKEQLAYVNQPGLDTSDISRGFVGSLPFMFGGGVAGKALQKVGAPLAGKVLGQTLTGAAVSGAQDIGASQMGSEQGIDLPKMIGGAAGGAIGELAAPVIGGIIRKFWTEPSLYNKATGTLTEKGMQAARSAGIDPLEMTAEIQKGFAQQLARSSDAKAAGVAAETGDLGILTTLGNRTKSKTQLMTEQELRFGVYGKARADEMAQFDERQTQSIINATMGEIEPGKPGVSLRLQPSRNPEDYSSSQIGAAIAERGGQGVKAMKSEASKKWKEVGNLEATEGAMAELPRYLRESLGDFVVRPPANGKTGHPVATQMLEMIDEFKKGEAPKQVVDWLATTPAREVNKFRTTLSETYRDLPQGSADRTAAERIYEGYRSWIREMADRGLLEASSPDAVMAAAAMREASGLTYNVHNILKAGGNQEGAAILKKILAEKGGADSAGNVVRALFQGQDSKFLKPGSISAIESLQKIATKLPGDEGANLIADLKLAYWLQLTRDGTAEAGKQIYGPQVLLRNLRNSAENHRELWIKLFSPEDIRLRNQYIRALEKGPTYSDKSIRINSSNTAMSTGRMFMNFVGTIVGPGYAKVAKEALYKVTGRARANVFNATSQELPAVNPRRISPFLEAGGAAGAQSQE